MARTSFEDLQIYQMAEKLSGVVWVMVKAWDRLALDTVGKQLIRAADSVGANIAEGSGRYSYKEKARFGLYSRGSLYETKHWLRLAHARDLVSETEARQLAALLRELLPMLSAYIRSMRAMSNNPK
ncbi:hypothetical protein BH23BAC4_BH23BAC4_16920 [soil metagenome]